MPSSVLKLMMLLMTPSRLLKDSRIDLPLGCKDFKLIKGNLMDSRTVILGEEHYVCDEARRLCTESIINFKQIFSDEIVSEKTSILFEELGHDQHVMCEEVGHEKLAAVCRGWNIHGKKMNEIHSWYNKANVMQNLQTEFREKFQELLSLPKSFRIQQAVNYVGHYIQQGKIELRHREAEYNYFIKQQSNKKQPNLFSFTLSSLKKEQFRQQQLNIILKRIKNADSLTDIWTYIVNISDKYTDLYNNFIKDHNASFVEPNKAMPKAIKEGISNGKKLMFVYAGDRHVNKHCTRQDAHPKQDEGSIQGLYDALDEFADENPYAVLSCSLPNK